MALAGCGAKGAVEATVNNTSAAFARGDGNKACASLSEDAKRIVVSFRPPLVTCQRVIEALAPQAFTACRGGKVKEVSVEGSEQARALVGGPGGKEIWVYVRKEGTDWELRGPPCGPGIRGKG